jgi:hypothetical protein
MVFVIVMVSGAAWSQYGSAPDGYYPTNYGGSIFMGKFVKGNPDQTLTLSYTKGSKTELFVGKLQKGCGVPTRDGSKTLMNAPDFPPNSVVTAFFQKITRKEGDKKIKENQVIAISFVEVDGQKIADDKRLIYYCAEQGQMIFRAYGTPRY